MDSMWNKVAGRLSEKYTVVCVDLRGASPTPLHHSHGMKELMTGYGRSSKPLGSKTHIEYSKRELANDLVQLMSHFKFEKFNILAHDRGARVAHRLCLDHPKSVEKVVLLDIAPTLWMYERTDMAFVSLRSRSRISPPLWSIRIHTGRILVRHPPFNICPHHPPL
jgi:haloacetate dehalogenase